MRWNELFFAEKLALPMIFKWAKCGKYDLCRKCFRTTLVDLLGFILVACSASYPDLRRRSEYIFGMCIAKECCSLVTRFGCYIIRILIN